jgi:hypothetical protein
MMNYHFSPWIDYAVHREYHVITIRLGELHVQDILVVSRPFPTASLLPIHVCNCNMQYCRN